MQKFNKELFKEVRILYVEDDPMTSEEISFFLKKYVKELYVAKNGKEGLELFEKHNPDMVITDIQMPIMNGLDMVERIFEIDATVPVAVTTAYSDSEYLMRAIELGIDKYIIKPIDMLEILAVIQKSLNLKVVTNDETHYESYIQFILDSNPTFMFVMHSDEVEFANKKFLDLLGHENLVSLKEQIQSCEDLFTVSQQEEKTNWIEYIKNSGEKRHVVQLKNPKCKRYLKTDFVVSYKHFENTNKSVFVFINANEERLNRIHDISSSLLKSGSINEETLSELKEIMEISRF